MKTVSFYKSPMGLILMAANDDSLCGLWFSGQQNIPEEYAKMAPAMSLPEVLVRTRNWLDRYFAGKRPNPAELDLAPEGTEFRCSVWKALCSIPYGETTTYGQIAKDMQIVQGIKTSAQAVGGAVAHNPISIIIPCHRVVGADGSMTGYAGGIHRKKALLALESK